MSDIEKLLANYKVGQGFLTNFFTMKSKDLKEKLNSLCGSKISNDRIFIDGIVRKISEDNVPEKIEIIFYDKVVITPWGITYKPENGPVTNIVDFNEWFQII